MKEEMSGSKQKDKGIFPRYLKEEKPRGESYKDNGKNFRK